MASEFISVVELKPSLSSCSELMVACASFSPRRAALQFLYKDKFLTMGNLRILDHHQVAPILVEYLDLLTCLRNRGMPLYHNDQPGKLLNFDLAQLPIDG